MQAGEHCCADKALRSAAKARCAASEGASEQQQQRDQEAAVVTPSGFAIDRSELVRTLEQLLLDLGYSRAFYTLQSESQVRLQHPAVAALRSAVLTGHWSQVSVAAVPQSPLDTVVTAVPLSSQLDCVLPLLYGEGSEKLETARFYVLKQQFLEMLEYGQFADAMACLRLYLAHSSHVDVQDVSNLSALVMYTDREELYKKAAWDGAQGQSRQNLLNSLQEMLDSALFLPSQRLLNLLDQAFQQQISKCSFHNLDPAAMSLVQTHSCSSSRIPRECIQALEVHENEVWYVQFSNNGKRLASASKDSTIAIWDILPSKEVRLAHHLRGHSAAVSFIAWSPDDSLLLACGSCPSVKLWSASSGRCSRTFSGATDTTMACAWLPDSNHFVTAGLDHKIILWSRDGQILHTWRSQMINDLSVSPDGKTMVALSTDNSLSVFSLETRQRLFSLSESLPTTSFSLSRDGRFALVNVSKPAEIHLWDLHEKCVVRTFHGVQQDRYIVRSAIGGVNGMFVVSGSEDSLIYLWHQPSGRLIRTLSGHCGSVNCVAWNPVDPTLIASASDDHTVRLWSTGSRCSDA